MNQELFELVKELDLKDVETQLAMQCAPVIMGLKISNLLIIPNENVNKAKEIITGSNLSYFILLKNEEKTTLLLYWSDKLKQYLSKQEVKELLWELGYQKITLEYLFPIFIRRYVLYCKRGGNFPHEMGILLGYPIEDVRGFIENEGRNFIYTGYWKVYEHVGEKLQIFKEFELAKKILLQLMSRGISMAEVIRKN